MNNTYSLERQDLFVEKILPVKNGFFLDVGCNHPVNGNNTYLLEKKYQWTGIGFDLGFEQEWKKERNSKIFLVDATSPALTEILKREVDGRVVDYLSLDIDVGGYRQANLSYLALPRILDAGISFKCATIEHEAFKYGPRDRDLMRKTLTDLGYEMLFEGIRFPTGEEFEDWWINPIYFDKNITSKRSSGVSYEEAVKILSN